jgi:hypothetical protein
MALSFRSSLLDRCQVNATFRIHSDLTRNSIFVAHRGRSWPDTRPRFREDHHVLLAALATNNLNSLGETKNISQTSFATTECHFYEGNIDYDDGDADGDYDEDDGGDLHGDASDGDDDNGDDTDRYVDDDADGDADRIAMAMKMVRITMMIAMVTMMAMSMNMGFC